MLKSNVTNPNQVVLCINVTQGTDTKVKALCIEMYAEGCLVSWLEMQEKCKKATESVAEGCSMLIQPISLVKRLTGSGYVSLA